MPPNHNRRWVESEEELLLRLVGLRFSIEVIARIMGRSTRAIIARALRLNTQGRLTMQQNDEGDDDLPGGAPPQGNNRWNQFITEWRNPPEWRNGR